MVKTHGERRGLDAKDGVLAAVLEETLNIRLFDELFTPRRSGGGCRPPVHPLGDALMLRVQATTRVHLFESVGPVYVPTERLTLRRKVKRGQYCPSGKDGVLCCQR